MIAHRFAIVLALVACGPTPVPPVPLPPSDCQTVACACERMCQLGCGECLPECEATVLHILATRLTHISPACMAAARTKAEARACPAVDCP
jgi:hypothetical protein